MLSSSRIFLIICLFSSLFIVSFVYVCGFRYEIMEEVDGDGENEKV